MTDDDAITPDRLRLAGWDDRFGVFARDGREDVFWLQRLAGTWLWLRRDRDPALLTGMADVAARLAAAEAGAA